MNPIDTMENESALNRKPSTGQKKEKAFVLGSLTQRIAGALLFIWIGGAVNMDGVSMDFATYNSIQAFFHAIHVTPPALILFGITGAALGKVIGRQFFAAYTCPIYGKFARTPRRAVGWVKAVVTGKNKAGTRVVESPTTRVEHCLGLLGACLAGALIWSCVGALNMDGVSLEFAAVNFVNALIARGPLTFFHSLPLAAQTHVVDVIVGFFLSPNLVRGYYVAETSDVSNHIGRAELKASGFGLGVANRILCGCKAPLTEILRFAYRPNDRLGNQPVGPSENERGANQMIAELEFISQQIREMVDTIDTNARSQQKIRTRIALQNLQERHDLTIAKLQGLAHRPSFVSEDENRLREAKTELRDLRYIVDSWLRLSPRERIQAVSTQGVDARQLLGDEAQTYGQLQIKAYYMHIVQGTARQLPLGQSIKYARAAVSSARFRARAARGP